MTETTYPIEARVAPLCSMNIYRTMPHELGPFRPRRLLVPSDVAPHFLIINVKVDHNYQFACPAVIPAVIPATLFDEAGPPTSLYFELVPPNRFFAVSVTNASSEERTFRCLVAGVHDPKRINPNLENTVMGLGYTTARPESPRVCLRVQPQVPFTPQRLHVPENVLSTFRIDSLGVQKAFINPPKPDALYPAPDTPSDFPTHSNADPASLTSEEIRSSGAVSPGLASCCDFVRLTATLTADHPVAFCGALVGTMSW